MSTAKGQLEDGMLYQTNARSCTGYAKAGGVSKRPCGRAAWLVVQEKRHAAIASVNQREQTELAKEHAALEDRQTAAAAETADARAGMAQARVLRKEEEEYEVSWSVAYSAAMLLPTLSCTPPDIGRLTTKLRMSCGRGCGKT